MLPLQVITRRVRLSTLSFQTVRTYAGYWNKDWKPGPYPKTEEERRAAAKKYGLIPEDYEPYADDGTGYGDYPKIPIVSAESRDPHENFDFDELKRNFGEPFHVDCVLYGEDRWDKSRRLRFSLTVMNLTFLGVISFFGLLAWIGTKVRICFVKMMPKQYPVNGKKHYTFELKGAEHGQSC